MKLCEGCSSLSSFTILVPIGILPVTARMNTNLSLTPSYSGRKLMRLIHLVREKIKSLDVECLWWRAGGARAGAPACEMSPQFYCRIGSRMRNLANHEHH